MKKVLALVLALTMIVGFASTSFAAYSKLFATTNTAVPSSGVPVFDLYDGSSIVNTYSNRMTVSGNKEYTVKYKMLLEDMVGYSVFSTAYASISKEYQVRAAIDQYYSYYPNWSYNDAYSELYPILGAIYGTTGSAVTGTLWTNLDAAMLVYARSQDVTTVGATQVDGNTVAGAFLSGYAGSTAFKSAYSSALTNYNTFWSTGYGYIYNNVTVDVISKDTTYASITTGASYDRGTNQPEILTNSAVGGEFKVKFTNTTFAQKEVKLEVTFTSKDTSGNVYQDTYTLAFLVNQAQTQTFTEGMAVTEFRYRDDIEISASDYSYIAAGAFRVMLQNPNRSITVISGIGQSKVKFDKDSTNLPQDIFIGNFKTSGTGTADAATISGFSSTTAAKIKIAVGNAYYTTNSGKTISVYDANGNKLDVEATLQGDYTVNFFAPLSTYTIAGPGYTPTTSGTTTDKTNPSMGGK